MKTKMIICENQVEQKMIKECYFRKKFTLFCAALLDNNQRPEISRQIYLETHFQFQFTIMGRFGQPGQQKKKSQILGAVLELPLKVGPFLGKRAGLAVLSGWQLQNGLQDFDFFLSIIINGLVKNGCFSLNIHNCKNDTSLFSISNSKI